MKAYIICKECGKEVLKSDTVEHYDTHGYGRPTLVGFSKCEKEDFRLTIKPD